ncbi:MBL fold metallo-hydrolase [Marinobacteraceae bacterium S3BR75-40.1]
MGLKVHHLNTATLCTGTRKLINGKGSWLNPTGWLRKGQMVCHCLLIETAEGLVLVDTGFGLDDVSRGDLTRKLLLRSMGAMADPAECAISQIRALGYQPDDVRHIILTHLDPDHAGGIKDFPRAQVHVHRREWEAAMNPATTVESYRYQRHDWAHAPTWVTHKENGERWNGFKLVRPLAESLPEVLMIPLIGHSRGHCGVAVDTTDGWLLHCGDAYFNHTEVAGRKATPPPGIALLEAFTETHREQRLDNLDRLRLLHRQGGAKLICSHDPDEYHQCCGH